MDAQRMDRVLLTTTEAAARLSIGRSKLYELIAEGSVRTVRIGRAVRVPAREVERFADDLVTDGAIHHAAS